MSKLSLTLPWPDKRLSPNARVHWRTRAAAASRARRITSKLCIESGLRRDLVRPLTLKTRVHLTITFYAPNRRRRDDDNLIAAFKPYRDELANHLLIDDSLFTGRYELHAPDKRFPNGAAVVTIGPVEVSLRLPTDG